MSQLGDSNSGPEEKDSPQQDAEVTDVDTVSQDRPLIAGMVLACVVAGLALAMFLIALDTTIVATAIPYITDEFHSTQDIGWYGAAYFLTLCSLQPLSGKLYATFSLKWTFLCFFGIFELGSLLCATAISSDMFIAGRAVAGAGGSGVVLGSFSIVSFIIPLVQRPLYIGILSSVFSVATVVGPILGGAFTQNATWRWCFYVNLPIGGAAAVALALVFNLPPQPRDKSALVDRLRQLDLVGAALFIPAVLMALLALQWGGSTYAWHSATIIGLFVGFGGLLAVFVGWEVYMKDDAMIPLSMVLSRTIAFSSLIGLFALGGVFVAVYYLPEWFQVVKGASPVGSGVMNIPAFLSQVLATILAGGLVAQFGALNPWLWLGAVLMAVGTGLYGTLDIDTSSGRWIGYQILQGFGFGTVAQMPVVALQTVLTPAQAPVGMAIAAFAQFFGSAIFVGIAQAIFTNVLVSQLAVEAPGVDVQALLLAGSGAVRHIVSPEDLPAVLEAFNKAIVSTFYLSAAACAAAVLVSLGLPWINLKAKRPVVSPGEA